jgi:capsular exopolysaccharide synthesis family protein
MSGIVVDANLRAPSLHRIFNVANDQGLTTLLAFPEEVPEAMLIQTSVPGVWLMPTGSIWYGSIDLLNSARLAEIIRELKELSDVVLVDTPPIQRFSDALAVIDHTDGAILVGTSGRTVQSALRRAANTLSQTGARIIGVVLNRDSGQIDEGRTPPTTIRKVGTPGQPKPARSVRPIRVRRETPEPPRPTTIPVSVKKEAVRSVKNSPQSVEHTAS